MYFENRITSSHLRVEATSQTATPQGIEFFQKEKDRERRSKKRASERRRSKSQLALAIDTFSFFRRQAIPRSLLEMRLQRDAIHSAMQLRHLWSRCGEHDSSGEILWLEELSANWRHLRELLTIADSLQCNWISHPLEAVLQICSRYGDNQDFNLGSYLNLAAGHEWFPFPFLSLIHRLYEENLLAPHTSNLQLWIGLLTDLIQTWKLQSIPRQRVC